MKVLKQILPHWSISVALIAVLIASSSIISTTNKSVMTVHASTTTTQAKAPVIKPGALVSEIVKVDVIDSKGNKITFSAIKGSTLEAAMKLAKVTVPTTDELPMPLSTVLENDMSVVLTATNETVKNKNIRFKTVEKEDDSLAEGKTKVAQKGEQGKKEMTYETVVANNTVQSTKKISETTVQEPVDKIVLVGTKVKETKKVKEVVATKTEKPVAEKEEKTTQAATETEEILKSYQSVIEKIVTEKVEIPFKTTTKEVANGSQNTQNQVVQAGVNGIKEIKYRIRYQNGNQISKDVISEKVIKEPVDKIILVGTKEKEIKEVKEVVATTAETPVTEKVETATETVETKAEAPAAATSGRTMQVEATAYTGGGITATGINLNDNSKVIAVDPSVIPLGSRVLIDGYGEYIAGDTGGAINGNIIDVYVASHSEAISFGRRALTIHILN